MLRNQVFAFLTDVTIILKEGISGRFDVSTSLMLRILVFWVDKLSGRVVDFLGLFNL
jgi:hypothetical protein